MKSNYTAQRYAKALFEIAGEKKTTAVVLAECGSFIRLLEENATLKSVLSLPNSAKSEQLVINSFQQQFSPLFLNFLIVVLKNKRLDIINQIYDALQTLYELSQNRMRAKAITAIPLSDDDLSAVNKLMSNHFKTDVHVENEVDASIIGGIVIEINGQVFNASITEQFKKLKTVINKN